MSCSPSFESSTFASAVEQNANESFIIATSLSLGSDSAIFASGAACPEIFAQKVLLDCTMCITRCPNELDRKSTRLNSSHSQISYAVFCLKKNNELIYSAY